MAEMDIKPRSLYAKEYAKRAKTALDSKKASEDAYGMVEKKYGKDVSGSLKSYHEKNRSGEGKYAYGGPINLKDCKVNTVEKNPKHKKF